MALITDDATLDALGEQGVKPEVVQEVEPKIVPGTDTQDLPDINFVDTAGTNPDKDKDEPSKPRTIEDALSSAGFDPKEIEDRVIKDGEITEDLIAELKEKLDPLLVDSHVRAIRAEMALAKTPALEEQNKATEEMNNFIYDSVGGQDKFKMMSEVLKGKLSQDELDVLNAQLASKNKALVTKGVQDAVKAYKQATGRVGEGLMQGDPNGAVDTGFIFLDKKEYQSIVRTDKYKTDRVYKQKVDADRLKSLEMDRATTLPGQYYNVREGRMYAI